jgi:starch-binding outer membrane protein, SusD/RagB family
MKVCKDISRCLIIMVIFITSCENYFEPTPDNRSDESRVFNEAAFAEGILLEAYAGLPNAYSFEETASDDAVTNEIGRSFKRMATGEWSSQFNPLESWKGAYAQIFYLNYFLSVVDKVEWSWESPERQEFFKQRLAGEAYALRAWYYLDLLRKHGGIGKDGNLLGFIILDTYIEPALQDPNLPRNSFEDCVAFILSDCNKAIELLPLDYADKAGEFDYNTVFGPQYKNRVNARHAMAIKSRLLLHAASPAFNLSNAAEKWEQAADASAELLDKINGISGLSATGLRWYLNENDPDIIWRRDRASILSWETQNFPPSLFGNGRDNPSQNFVDAFPMANGYPINAAGSGYDQNLPYTNRDPRLLHYVVYNGNKIGTNVINTNVESPSDGINKTLYSTVTGYYLKKLMNEAVRLTPGNTILRSTSIPSSVIPRYFLIMPKLPTRHGVRMEILEALDLHHDRSSRPLETEEGLHNPMPIWPL